MSDFSYDKWLTTAGLRTLRENPQVTDPGSRPALRFAASTPPEPDSEAGVTALAVVATEGLPVIS